MSTLPNLGELVKDIAAFDAKILVEKDASYSGSWKKRGGIGAFFTLIRPWDRFEAIASRNNYDIFKIWEEEKAKGIIGQDGTFSAALQDLRRYLFLVECEMAHRTTAYPTSSPPDTPPSPPSLVTRYRCRNCYMLSDWSTYGYGTVVPFPPTCLHCNSTHVTQLP